MDDYTDTSSEAEARSGRTVCLFIAVLLIVTAIILLVLPKGPAGADEVCPTLNGTNPYAPYYRPADVTPNYAPEGFTRCPRP